MVIENRDGYCEKATALSGGGRGGSRVEKEMRVVRTQKLGEATVQSWDLQLRGEGTG